MDRLYELMDELMKYDKDKIQFVLYCLMMSDKISFTDLNAAYVEFLKSKDKRNNAKLTEATTTIMDMFLQFVHKETNKNSKTIHRALYNLNKSGIFNMKELNRTYNYNEETDKEYAAGLKDFEN